MEQTTVARLIERYRVFLLDAYGVLVDANRGLPGAAKFIAALEAAGREYYVVTNDASRSPETCSLRYHALGVSVPAVRVISSGFLLAPYYRDHHLDGAGTVVLGTDDTKQYVEKAGGEIVPLPADNYRDVRVLVIGDEAGYSLLEALDASLTLLYRKMDRGEEIDVVVPNPDLVYPKSDERYGIAAGSFANLLEGALQARAHHERARFVRLGKPHLPIFQEALRRASCPIDQVVMIGDQLHTDIRGANAAGIDSVLVISGIGRRPHPDAEVRPTYWLENLAS